MRLKGKVAAADGHLGGTATIDERDRHIAQGGHYLGRIAGADAGAVLPEGDSPDVVETVLDTPMASDQFQQAEWTGLFRGKTGDEVDPLLACLALGGDRAGELANLGDIRP